MRVFRSVLSCLLVAATQIAAQRGAELTGFDAVQAGRAGVDVAIAEGAAALLSNPAGLLNQRARWRVDVTLRAFLPELRYRGILDDARREDEPFLPAPYLGVVFNPSREDDGEVGDVCFGAAILHQAGFRGELRTTTQDYPAPDGIVRSSDYIDTGLHLGAAVQVSERLRIGATLSFLYSTFDLADALEVDVFTFQGSTPLGIPIGQLLNQQFGIEALRIGGELESKPTFGAQATLGALFDLAPELRLGLRWRSPSVREDYEADVTVDIARIFGEPDPVTFPDGFVVHYEGRIRDFQLPQSFAAGLAWRPHDAVLLSIEGTWIDWSTTHDAFRLDLSGGDNGGFNAFVGSDSLAVDQRLDWRDQYSLGVAVEWAPHENWVLRAGYVAQTNPVPRAATNPLAPAGTMHQVGLGVGYLGDGFAIDAAWLHSVRSSRRVVDSVVSSDHDGSFQSFAADSFLLTLSLFF